MGCPFPHLQMNTIEPCLLTLVEDMHLTLAQDLTLEEEVALELKVPPNGPGPWNHDIFNGYTVEFVWKSVSFDRMQNAMRTLYKATPPSTNPSKSLQ